MSSGWPAAAMMMSASRTTDSMSCVGCTHVGRIASMDMQCKYGSKSRQRSRQHRTIPRIQALQQQTVLSDIDTKAMIRWQGMQWAGSGTWQLIVKQNTGEAPRAVEPRVDTPSRVGAKPKWTTCHTCVAEWQMVTVASRLLSSMAAGMPTIFERPTTTARLPLMGIPHLKAYSYQLSWAYPCSGVLRVKIHALAEGGGMAAWYYHDCIARAVPLPTAHKHAHMPA